MLGCLRLADHQLRRDWPSTLSDYSECWSSQLGQKDRRWFPSGNFPGRQQAQFENDIAGIADTSAKRSIRVCVRRWIDSSCSTT